MIRDAIMEEYKNMTSHTCSMEPMQEEQHCKDFLREDQQCKEPMWERQHRKKRIIAAGHICLDITPVFPIREAADIGDILQPGKLIEIGSANVSAGGSVSNTGLGMKLLGADVKLMSKIGNDEFGNLLCDMLKNYGVSDAMIRCNDSTSYSLVLAIPGIDRIFLHNPGANNSFYASDITDDMLEDGVHFHFGYPTLMKSMYENDGDELVALFKKVKAKELSTSLDLSAVDPGSDAAEADWSKILKRVMPYVDFFVPSAEELCFMLDHDRFVDWQNKAKGRDVIEIIDIEKDIKPLGQKCIELGAKVVLIKCGALGMYYISGSDRELASVGKRAGLDALKWKDKEIFEKAYKPEKVLSGTGAGDTSIAGFITGMLNGESPEECMHLAAATGALCVSSYDSLSALKPINEIKEMIKAGWEKC